MERTYLCIDLKSFYASVECAARELDPMTTRLVVADPERSDKTICLAVSPALKALGVKNRCRVFEIPKNIDYIMAPPRMQLYIDCAAEIYGIYLRYLAKEDIYVYSVDEAFLDVTQYLKPYGLTASEMAKKLMDEVYRELGVRAACGIGSNLYLTKIALDITAKHSPDFIGVLTEESYRETLWDHTPLTDFWRIGPGIARKLAKYGIATMGDVARTDEDLLYRLFGVDAELLIDHAWGRESVTLADIRAYRPRTSCLSRGQVLMRDYSFTEGRLIVREMLDLLCLEMTDKGVVTPSVGLYVGYSNALHTEGVGGTASLPQSTSADSLIIPAVLRLYDDIVDPSLPVRRVYLTCSNITPEGEERQFSLFDEDADALEKNKKVQKAVLGIQKKYGKNAILKGMNYEEAATTQERNRQIGGHKSGQ